MNMMPPAAERFLSFSKCRRHERILQRGRRDVFWVGQAMSRILGTPDHSLRNHDSNPVHKSGEWSFVDL